MRELPQERARPASASTTRNRGAADLGPSGGDRLGTRTQAALSPRLHIALLLAVTLLGLGLRLYRLGHDPLWFDEAYTALTAKKPLGEILRLLRTETSAPLYYVLLHGWEQLVGDGDLRLRLLSALSGAALVPAIYLVGASLFSPTAGLIAAALAAVSPIHVHYSQELRMYGLVPAVALGFLYGVQRLIRAPDLLGVVVLASALTAGLYLHYFVLFLVPLAGAVLLSRSRARAVGYTAVAFGSALVAFAPWLATMLGQAGPSHATDWIAAWWKNRAWWTVIPWSLEVLGPGASYPVGWFKLGSSQLFAMVSLAFAAVVTAGAAWDATRARGEARTTLLLTLAAVFVPLTEALSVSLFRSPIYVVGRYDIIAWAPYLLLAGAVLARLPAMVALPAVALWMGIAGATLVPHFTTDRPLLAAASSGHLFADRIGRRAGAGDLVVFAASSRPTTEYYLGTWGERLRMMSYPLSTDEHLGWIDLRLSTDDAFAAAEADRLAAAVRALQPAPEHIWLVVPYAVGNRPLIGAIRGLGYAPDSARSAEQVLCFSKRPS